MLAFLGHYADRQGPKLERNQVDPDTWIRDVGENDGCTVGTLAVWLRNVIGIRRVGRSRPTRGASTASSERPGREERPDALDPPQRPHPARRARRDRPLGRAHRR